VDLPEKGEMLNNIMKWSGPRHQSGLLTA